MAMEQYALCDFLILSGNNENLIDFLVRHGVLLATKKCPRCGNIVNLNKEMLKFHCYKTWYERPVKKKRRRVQCDFKETARKGTWFHQSKLSVRDICDFVAFFMTMRPPRQYFLTAELKICSATIVNWSSFCRDVCIDYIKRHSEKLGGEGVTVEIDRAKMGKSKNDNGGVITDKWVFGGIERGANKIFLVPVPDQTHQTLLNMIDDWILPGTTVVSDCWCSYKGLEMEGFQHLTINRAMNFVDPSTGAHTRNIERVWREVRSSIPRYGRREGHLVGYLAEYMFKRKHVYRERISAFFRAISEMYPPGAAFNHLQTADEIDDNNNEDVEDID